MNFTSFPKSDFSSQLMIFLPFCHSIGSKVTNYAPFNMVDSNFSKAISQII